MAESPPESLGFWLREGRPRPMAAGHAHADLEINCVLAGSMRYFVRGEFIDLPPGRLALFWGAIPHRLIDCPPESRYVVGCIPLAMALRWRLDDELLARLLGGDLVLGEDDGDAARLQSWAAELDAGDDDSAEIVGLELQARLRRLGRHHDVLAGSASGDAAVERMAAFIAAHAHDDIDLRAIADAAGLHPKYAGTLFRRRCGMTPWQYLTRLRLAHAQRLLLAEPERSVIAVAHEAGFVSQSAFYDAFRRAFGCAPGEWRRGVG